MRKTLVISTTALFLLIAGVALAAGRDRFATMSLRGRYTGNLTISEHLQIEENTTLQIEARQLLALTFDGKSGVSGFTTVTAAIPGNPPTVYTCTFNAQGTYDIGENGLGTANLNITPTTDCAGPATLKLSLLVGGRNRSRIDVTIDGATGLGPDSVPIAIVGAGSLSE